MAIHSLFPTFVYQAALAGASISRDSCRELKREAAIIRKIDTDGQAWSEKNYLNGFTSYGSWDSLHTQSSVFSDLEKKIDRHVAKFARQQNWDLGAGRLKMVTCWVNIMPANTVHSLHLHPLSVVSGTFYVSIPRGASPIKFEDPRLERFMAQPPRKAKAPRQQKPFVTIEPKEGDVVLFDSWLRHEVPPSQSRGDRISVSFNYDWV